MGKPLSMDLRSRALAAVDEGMSCRAAARRFGVAAATVIRWHDRRRMTGGYAAKAQGEDTRSGRIEAHAPTILALHEARRDITLDELRRELGQAGVAVAISTLHRFFARHGITRKKKIGHAIEQDRADVLSQREAWFDGQLDLDPARLVFIDETWTATNMTRSHGRCSRGERLRMGYPHGHRKTTTLVAGLRMTGMVAPMVLDGPINGDWFEAYVGQVLVPRRPAFSGVLTPGLVYRANSTSQTGSLPLMNVLKRRTELGPTEQAISVYQPFRFAPRTQSKLDDRGHKILV